MAPLGEDRARAPARAPISPPLACTAKNAARRSAGRKCLSPCGKPARRWVPGTGALTARRPADGDVSWPAPASEQPGFREAQIARGAEDEMVVDGDVQEAPGVDQ